MYTHPYLAMRLSQARQADIQRQLPPLGGPPARRGGRLQALLPRSRYRPEAPPATEPRPALASGGP